MRRSGIAAGELGRWAVEISCSFAGFRSMLCCADTLPRRISRRSCSATQGGKASGGQKRRIRPTDAESASRIQPLGEPRGNRTPNPLIKSQVLRLVELAAQFLGFRIADSTVPVRVSYLFYLLSPNCQIRYSSLMILKARSSAQVDPESAAWDWAHIPRNWRFVCHLSGYSGPRVFTQSGPRVFG